MSMVIRGLISIRFFLSARLKKMEIKNIGRRGVKTFLLILGAIGFVLVGIWIIRDIDSDLIEKIFGVVSILFFGAAIPLGIKKLITNEDALQLDNYNLIIEPNSHKRIAIPWNKIIGFEEIRIEGVKFITIKVSNPQVWINGESNPAKRKLMQFNYSTSQTPFNITSSGLNISHKELFKLLNEFHKEYKT